MEFEFEFAPTYWSFGFWVNRNNGSWGIEVGPLLFSWYKKIDQVF